MTCDDDYAKTENEFNRYGLFKKVTTYVAVSHAGRVVLRPYRTGILEYDKHGRRIELIRKDISEKNYLKIIYGYDKFGRIIAEKCFSENNEAINAVNTQAHKCIAKYDKYGRRVEEKWFDCKDDTQCTIKIKRFFDSYGRIKEISYWRGTMRILHPQSRIHKIMSEYDNYNRCTSEKYYNCAEQPTSYANEGYSERRLEYYDYGKIKKESYYLNGKPCPRNSSLSPISSIEYEYDNNLRETKRIFRDINGNKCNNRDGVAEFIYFYDESRCDPVKEIRKDCNGKVLGEGNWQTTFVVLPNTPEIKKRINVLPGDRIIAWNQFNLFHCSSRDIIKQFESVVLSGWLNGNHLLVAREQKNGEFTISQFFCEGRLGIRIADQNISDHKFYKLKTAYDEWLKNNKEQQTFKEFKSITTAVFIEGVPIDLQKKYDLHNGDIVLKFNEWIYKEKETSRINLWNEIINSKSISMTVARKINGEYRTFFVKINQIYENSEFSFVPKVISKEEQEKLLILYQRGDAINGQQKK